MLYDTVGIGDLEWSAKLGAAAMELLSLVLRTSREPLVVEANFRRLDVDAHVVQVFCTDTAERLNDRYRARDRHPGHLDGERTIDPGEYVPLPLDGPVLHWRVGDDLARLLAAVRAATSPADTRG